VRFWYNTPYAYMQQIIMLTYCLWQSELLTKVLVLALMLLVLLTSTTTVASTSAKIIYISTAATTASTATAPLERILCYLILLIIYFVICMPLPDPHT
jgi:hypothetical protein